MPELMVDFITSLDGYGAADGWPGFWGLEGPEYLAWLGDQPEADYTVLMGANTYRLMSGLASEGEPGTDALAGMSKIVFSSTLTEPLSWPNTQLITEDPVGAVRGLKDEGRESMRTIGSLTLCRSLLGAGLVDRFRVVVFPVITGSTGKDRIYDGYPDVSLDPIRQRTFDGRLQLLEYVPTVLTGPPGCRRRRGEPVSGTRPADHGPDSMRLPQGDLGLVESEAAQRLLHSRIPARFAYLATDGTPRVVATWFHWTGEVMSMPTFLAAPHVRHPAGRLKALRANPSVAVTIDTETFPPEVLTLRGRVEISEVDGVPPEYEAAAHRYLGGEAAGAYLEQIDQPGTRMARIDLRPRWVGVHDFRSRLPSALGGIA